MLTGEEPPLPCEIQLANINVSILAYSLAPYSNLTNTRLPVCDLSAQRSTRKDLFSSSFYLPIIYTIGSLFNPTNQTPEADENIRALIRQRHHASGDRIRWCRKRDIHHPSKHHRSVGVTGVWFESAKIPVGISREGFVTFDLPTQDM